MTPPTPNPRPGPDPATDGASPIEGHPATEGDSALEPDPATESDATPEIQRHRTAIRRANLSVPIQCLLRDGLLDPARSLFDYGCGRGQDLELLRGMEIPCEGWDPVYRPDTERRAADLVNLGYVINVVEDPQERAEALRQAWGLSRSLLVVAAQLDVAAPAQERTRFNDGVLTSRGTFQKYYRQSELRAYLEEQLGTEAIPAAPGIFYLFKDETAQQQFLSNRYRRREVVPRRRISEILFEQNQDLLEPFMERLTQLGRLPGPEEFPESAALIERLGSLKRAFAVIRRVTEEEPWETIARHRSDDLLVYLALARFHKRPILSKLPLGTQRDVKAFFGTYDRACRAADELLMTAGDAEAIDTACQRAPVGRLVDNALIVHRSALDHLEPLLRIYEGCARALVGEIEGANVIKLHRFSGKVSYLVYPEFDTDPHPALRLRVKVNLRTLDMEWFDYASREDPFILYRKEALVPEEFPGREKFAKLTAQEERVGLLKHERLLDTRGKLAILLDRAGLKLAGHSLRKASRSTG